jgi:hypothetical protein
MAAATFLEAHLAINGQNLERSLDFYTRLFGLSPCKVRTGYANFDIASPPLNFTLNQRPFSEAGALSHMGMQVSSTAEVLAVRQQWMERGLIPRDEMQTDCCYARQDKTWVKDPDGKEWEVFVVIEDNLPEKASAAEGATRGRVNCCAPAVAEASHA